MQIRMTPLTAWLAGLVAWGTEGQPPVPFVVGPDIPEDIPGKVVVVTPAPGPGLNTEDLLEASGVQVRVIGEQNDYNSAEEMAQTLDIALLRQARPRVGGVLINDILRSGGGPAPDRTDDAERTHFVCSYVFNAASGIEGG